MENYNQQRFSDYTVVSSDVTKGTSAVAKNFMANVFLWMAIALGVSTLFAFLFADNLYLLQYLVDNQTGRLNMLGWITIFAPIGFVLLMAGGINRFSLPVLAMLFLAYSAVNGISFSFILLKYTPGSIVSCFASAGAVFGIMSIMGYTTDKDLTSFGRILMMGLIGIVVCVVINLFIGSPALNYIISIIGVVVFTGLTAYDTQKLKRIGAGLEYDGTSPDDSKKLAIMGALRLYLDFINLFLMLLNLFGKRR